MFGLLGRHLSDEHGSILLRELRRGTHLWYSINRLLDLRGHVLLSHRLVDLLHLPFWHLFHRGCVGVCGLPGGHLWHYSMLGLCCGEIHVRRRLHRMHGVFRGEIRVGFERGDMHGLWQWHHLGGGGQGLHSRAPRPARGQGTAILMTLKPPIQAHLQDKVLHRATRQLCREPPSSHHSH